MPHKIPTSTNKLVYRDEYENKTFKMTEYYVNASKWSKYK